MSKITNDGLTRSGTGCYIAVPIIWQLATVGVKVLTRAVSTAYNGSLTPCLWVVSVIYLLPVSIC